MSLLTAVVGGLCACGGGASSPHGLEPLPGPLAKVALSDAIDYGALGSGRLCFERIVLNSSLGRGGVFVVDATARTSWGFENSIYSGGGFTEPAISPDGLRIAYSALSDTVTYWDIYIIAADGGYPAREVAGPDNEGMPAWTPGQGLVWKTSGSGTGLESRASLSPLGAMAEGYNRYIRVTGAGPPTRIDPPPHAALAAPAFSPDGRELAWICFWNVDTVADRMEIVVANADGSHGEAIATVPLPGGLLRIMGGNDVSLAWSPDQRLLAFNRPESDRAAHVFVVTREGGRLTQITSAPNIADRSVSWSYLP